ncbi:MAG: hypothetical protein FWE80_05885, partial [Oscillospiraceae bacterium]|nr:hypothetical protein [Oscillospiraceae bacterium]
MLLQKSTKRTPALMVAVLLLSAIVFFVFMRGSSYAGDPAGYALFENGTVLDEGVLIYYTIPGLKQLWRDAVSGNAVFDDDARREVLDQLPFSEAAGQQFLEKYNDGKTWYLVDTVQTLYKNAENTPDQPSTAYIVSSRGVSALEFIFITRNDEQFFVHIDTDDVNAEIKTALTGYSETAGPPPQQIMRASALLAPGGTPAGELELSDTEVAGSEFLIDQDVAIASVLIVGQGEEGTHTWTKVTQYSELQNGQIWTYKEVEEVTPGANDGLFKITLYAWA